jgi:hypothetical protein
MQLKEISEEQAKKQKLIGTAMGIDIDHCIFEGMKHSKNFKKRAKYYVVKIQINDFNENARLITNSNEMMVVDFYE